MWHVFSSWPVRSGFVKVSKSEFGPTIRFLGFSSFGHVHMIPSRQDTVSWHSCLSPWHGQQGVTCPWQWEKKSAHNSGSPWRSILTSIPVLIPCQGMILGLDTSHDIYIQSHPDNLLWVSQQGGEAAGYFLFFINNNINVAWYTTNDLPKITQLRNSKVKIALYPTTPTLDCDFFCGQEPRFLLTILNSGPITSRNLVNICYMNTFLWVWSHQTIGAMKDVS